MRGRPLLVAFALVFGLLLAIIISLRAPTTAPSMLLGSFEDDYAARYVISPRLWQHQDSRYLITRWVPDEMYAIAQNAPGNSGEAGLWTRIDWVVLEGMPPWEWAFCLTVWDAPTEAAAMATPAADRVALRTGCGGFPFSRMKSVPGADSH